MPHVPASNSRRVVVTAVGVVSPLGHGARETTGSLQNARDCVTPVACERFDVSLCRSKTAGQVVAATGGGRSSLNATGEPRGARLASRELRPPEDSPSRSGPRRWHAASHLLAEAVREVAAGDAGFRPELMVIGTTSGGMSFGEHFFRAQLLQTRPRERAAWLANYMPQKALLDAQGAAGFSCPSQIIANACASGTNAVGHAFQLIRAGLANAILCGGYDVISELVFVGFDSLQASTAEQIRPFDRARSGLVLGEGAAVLALEDAESARRRGAPILAEITGYGISTDNHHLTQPHPSGIGPRLAMQRALDDARRRAEEVGYINAHGTATTFNDATEGIAIAELFGDRVAVSSTKSMMGHALGGAGAIEAVFSVLALQHGFLPPNIHYAEADPTWRLDIVANEARDERVDCIVSNSFGFGGTNASLVLERAA